VAQSTVRLIVDAQNAVSPLRRVNDATKNLSKNTDKLKNRLNKSNRAIRDSGRSATAAAGGFRTLNRSLGPLLKILAVIGATRFVFINAADIETQRKSLEVLTGSLSKTNQIIKELQDFGAVTPFKSSELIEQTKRLKAFGFETDELVDTTKRLADVAGATGADLQGIATAFGQIRAKGKLQQEENLQLLERGVDITTELKNITGLQGEAFEKAQRQGKIGADLVNQALINLTNEGGAFFEGASSQATTLNGKLSTLIDSTESLARTIGEQLSPAIKGALDLATKGVVAIEKIFSRFGDIGDVGLGNVAKAEQDAQRDAARLTATKFGTNFKGESIFASKEENEFFREQFKLLRKANIEREKLKQKSFEEVPILEESNKKQTEKTEKIIETNNAATAFNQTLDTSLFILDEAITQTDGLKEKFMEIGQGIEDGIVSGLTDAVMGTKTLAEAATGVLNNLKRKLVEVAMQRAVSGIGNFFGNALSGIFGGGKRSNVFSGSANVFSGAGSSFDMGLLGFANGGRPPIGKASIVGERGPELFVPKVAGTIIPNNAIGGGGTTNNMITVNVDASGTSVQGNGSEADQLGGLIASVVQATIIDEQRAGGLLNR
jgi:tape measure domain-containing protein